jgi:phytoene synthase
MTVAAEFIPPVEAFKARASASSFYAAMRLLPKAERDAMFRVYYFCRAVDDIADDRGGSRAERAHELDVWRHDIEQLYDSGRGGRAAALCAPVQQFHLEKADFLTVIDGMQMDVDQDIRGPNLAVLDLYCERVASAVGRLSVRIFGMERAAGEELAHYLGRALQLTNILRDLDEDAALGRLYVPAELLDAAGVVNRDPLGAVADRRVDSACRSLARRARGCFEKADAVLARKPAGRLIAARLMSAVYSRLLDKTERRGWAPPRVRAKLGKPELLGLLVQHGLFH